MFSTSLLFFQHKYISVINWAFSFMALWPSLVSTSLLEIHSSNHIMGFFYVSKKSNLMYSVGLLLRSTWSWLRGQESKWRAPCWFALYIVALFRRKDHSVCNGDPYMVSKVGRGATEPVLNNNSNTKDEIWLWFAKETKWWCEAGQAPACPCACWAGSCDATDWKPQMFSLHQQTVNYEHVELCHTIALSLFHAWVTSLLWLFSV